MKGTVVAADAGSTGDIWATAHRAEHGFADIRRFEGLAPTILGQQAGGSDGDISGMPALIQYTADKPALRHGEGVDDNRMIPRRAAEQPAVVAAAGVRSTTMHAGRCRAPDRSAGRRHGCLRPLLPAVNRAVPNLPQAVNSHRTHGLQASV